MEQYQNLAFSGGGVLGIAYLGMVEYLCQMGLMPGIRRVAGTSAGAITACITAFNLPFSQTKKLADSLDYSRVAAKTDSGDRAMAAGLGDWQESLFGSVDCAVRLFREYGWYSSDYLYDWLRKQIAQQFDPGKKQPPYTFADFENPALHREGRAFKGLYVVGTDLSTRTTAIFSAKDTPRMEVAEAVRISMSVPLLFQSVESSCGREVPPEIYVDGGLLYNYPITLFDRETPPAYTLGALLQSSAPPPPIHSLPDFMLNLISCSTAIQAQLFQNSPMNQRRSIVIETGEVAPMDFNIAVGNPTYTFLYRQGYRAAAAYFAKG